ncbi:TetR/AcrR family transcriptional regulator [Enterococcus sp. LJL51]|uniref:TetR/AcrR family transcriptional regulator n=1 Tax=Enterococcus sp. LJL51 TaxID=3416656 RepID=UPI003CE7CCB3
MPKVTEEYIQTKKQAIINAFLAVCEKKVLYEITMTDVIKEINISKGGIYRYFEDLDDLLVSSLNQQSSNENFYTILDKIIKPETSSSDNLQKLFVFLGEYVESNVSVIGKIQYELTAMLASQPDRQKKILGRLNEQAQGQYWMKQVMIQISKGIESGEFTPLFSIEVILSFMSGAIDGITGSIINQCYYQKIKKETLNIPKLFEALNISVLSLLTGGKSNES